MLAPVHTRTAPPSRRLPAQAATTGVAQRTLLPERPHARKSQGTSRRKNIEHLISQSVDMRGQRADVIWATITKRLVEFHRREGHPPQATLTAVMEDMGAVFNGGALRNYLSRYARIHPGANNQVRVTLDRLKTLGVDALRPDRNIDATQTRSLRPEFADHSEGQIYHGAFYLVMGYLTRDPTSIRLGSILHESRGGGSKADHAMALAAARLGARLCERATDSSDSARELLDTLPSLIGGAFGSRGDAFRLHPQPSQRQVAAAQKGDRWAREFIDTDRQRVESDWESIIPVTSWLRDSWLGRALRKLI